MTNEVTHQQKVVMTRNGATFYLSRERADMLQAMLQSNNKPEYVELDDTLIAVREITMIAGAEKVEEMNKRRQGFWLCPKGHWHSRDESVCKQGWGMNTSIPPENIEEKELSPEAKARGLRIRELMSSGMSLKDAVLTVKKEKEAKS